MASAGGDPSWQAMVSVRTSIVPPGPCPPLPDTPGTSPAVTAPQVTASIHDFAGSLVSNPAMTTQMQTTGAALLAVSLACMSASAQDALAWGKLVLHGPLMLVSRL